MEQNVTACTPLGLLWEAEGQLKVGGQTEGQGLNKENKIWLKKWQLLLVYLHAIIFWGSSQWRHSSHNAIPATIRFCKQPVLANTELQICRAVQVTHATHSGNDVKPFEWPSVQCSPRPAFCISLSPWVRHLLTRQGQCFLCWFSLSGFHQYPSLFVLALGLTCQIKC